MQQPPPATRTGSLYAIRLERTRSAAWTRIAPLLDGTLAQLGAKDHDAIVLRFFDGKSFKDVGAALGTSEDGAKMRVHRALEVRRNLR